MPEMTSGEIKRTHARVPGDRVVALRLAAAGLFIPLLLCVYSGQAGAQFDPSKVRGEPEQVARRFPDPSVEFDTPGFAPGRMNFPSHYEVLAYLQDLASKHPRLRLEWVGRSQQGLPIPLVVLSGAGGFSFKRPTVLILGQQHGNEPGGGEAALALARRFAGEQAAMLDRVNLLIMPRANPDGAQAFVRATANGQDVNRDHLLLRTPEGSAIAAVARRYRPQVVLDLHEFTVGDRWIAKFGAWARADGLLQGATVGNLNASIAAATSSDFLVAARSAIEAQGLMSFWYHTASSDPKDLQVSMGGVNPDTGRNVGGLRNAVSILLETRGIGIGRAHFKRRVHTHVLAASAIVDEAAKQGPALLSLVQKAGAEVAALACRGELVVNAGFSMERMIVPFVDDKTGEDKPVEVAWRSALKLTTLRSRPRPCGYLIAAGEKQAIDALARLGLRTQRVADASRWVLERYRVEGSIEGKREDARGAINDPSAIRVLAVKTEAASVNARSGPWVFVSLAQPLANLAAAALEPDSQNSYAANRLMEIEGDRLLRVMRRPGGEN